MNRARTRICIGVCAALALTSCATGDHSKADIGAILGGVVGAAAGSQVASKNNKALGVVLGAALGAGLGYAIGKQLDKQDQAALQAKIEQAAASNSANVPSVWNSDHSGASATITPAEPTAPSETTKTIAKEEDVAVDRAVPLRFATGARQATADVNIRQGPGTSYPVKYVLRLGRLVDVIGMTDDGWYVVAQGGVAVGYVSGRYLQSPGERKVSTVRSAPAPVETKPQASARDIESAARQAKKTQEVDVRVAATCRPVRVRLKTADGQIKEDTVQTCQNPDGSWGA